MFAACTGNSAGSANATQCSTVTLPPTCGIETVDIKDIPNEGSTLRTSFAQFPVTFDHNGGPGTTYTARAVLSDPADSSTSITESECTNQKLTVFFANSGQKSIQIAVFQRETNREVTSTQPLPIIYDKAAPEITIQRVFIGGEAVGTGLEYSSGTTYYTSDEVVIRARVVDPAPAQAPEELGIKIVSGRSLPQDIIPPTNADNPSLFETELGISQEQNDGEYLIRVAGIDDKDGFFDDNSPANVGDSKLIRVVLDTVQPVISRVELIRDPGTASQTTENLPGAYINAGRVRVRVTFSEALSKPPTLLIAQQGNGVGDPPTQPIQATFDSQLFNANPSVVEYEFAPLVGPSDTGPATFQFQEDGFDLAGKELDINAGLLNGGEMERAVIIDVNPPSLNRLQDDSFGEVQTIPANNAKIPRDGFPRQITAIVRDYNLPSNIGEDVDQQLFETNNASGVDFSKVADFDTQQGDVIKVELTDPNSTVIPGTLVTQPPNGLVYLLPNVDDIYPDLRGSAPEGVYTVRIFLVDRVGNTSIETFFFQVDNTAIPASSFQVSLGPAGQGFDSGNLFLENPIGGREIPDLPNMIDLRELDSVRELAEVLVCSTDPSFNLTRSVATLKARLHGPDTVARPLTINTSDATGLTNTCETGGALTFGVNSDQTEPFPDLVAFPNPVSGAGEYVDPGTRDPRFGLFDGPYQVEIVAQDEAGNVSDPILKEFLLDTTQPYTDSIFPPNHSKINSPLRHVSTVFIDPHPPRLHTHTVEGHLNFGSGINVDQSNLRVFLAQPYRADAANKSGFFSTVPEGLEVRRKLSFIHIPNSLDPTKPGYNPKDDKYRVLLEFIDANGAVTALPEDGSVDGIYRLDSFPVDNAGNSIAPAVNGGSGWRPFEGDVNRPQRVTREFTFLLDSIAPNLEIDGALTEININGLEFRLSGKTRDLSAQTESSKGGSGIHKVEYEMVYLTEDGELIPGTDGTQGKRKSNPIFTGRLATLAEIEDPSKDPTSSLSKPIDPAAYSEIELEEREWVINGELPPASEIIGDAENQTGKVANYFLRVKSFDFAGNVTIKVLKVNLSLNKLPAPIFEAPVQNASLTNGVVNFEWFPVANAAEYVLSLSRPASAVETYAVSANGSENVRFTKVLFKEGEYEWWVVAKDTVGNLGELPVKSKFTMDRTDPKVQMINWVDLSPESSGKLTIGQFKLQIHFSEPLETAPKVTFDPFGTSVSRQLVKTDSFEKGFNLWQGVATIPETAAANWDGIAVIEISHAKDAAGNQMDVNRDHTFEIDTGPSYEIKFFENPVYRSELILMVLPSEVLLSPPVLLNPQGVSFANASMIRIGERAYSSVVKLSDNLLVEEGAMQISGSDLNGNSITRVVRFPIASVVKKSSSSINSSFLRMRIPEGAFDSDKQLLAILPSPEIVDIDIDDESNKSLLKLNSSENSELQKIRELEQVVPSDVELKKPVSAELLLTEPLAEGQGLFLESSAGLQLLTGAKGLRHKMSLNRLGKFVVYEDRTPPQIHFESHLDEMVLGSRNPKFTFQVSDNGSGVSRDNVEVKIAGVKLQVQSLGMGQFEGSYSGSLARGNHKMEVQVADRLGNKSVQRTSLLVAGPIKLSAYSYPNPAKDVAYIRYDLNRPAQRVSLKIYDSSGRKVVSVDSFSDMSLSGSTGKNVYPLRLETDEGLSFANGVYLCQISVKDEQGRLDKKHLKIVVLN